MITETSATPISKPFKLPNHTSCETPDIYEEYDPNNVYEPYKLNDSYEEYKERYQDYDHLTKLKKDSCASTSTSQFDDYN